MTRTLLLPANSGWKLSIGLGMMMEGYHTHTLVMQYSFYIPRARTGYSVHSIGHRRVVSSLPT